MIHGWEITLLKSGETSRGYPGFFVAVYACIHKSVLFSRIMRCTNAASREARKKKAVLVPRNWKALSYRKSCMGERDGGCYIFIQLCMHAFVPSFLSSLYEFLGSSTIQHNCHSDPFSGHANGGIVGLGEVTTRKRVCSSKQHQQAHFPLVKLTSR